MLNLVTFGGLALESVNEAVVPRLSAQRLAILAVLAAEGDRRVSRERLTGLFWPDADEERARHSLRQALYTLRQEIGRDVVRSDFALSLDTSALVSDVAAFRASLARGDRLAAARLVRGAFLDGFYLPGAAPFQRWVEDERARLRSEASSAILALATEASAAHELDAAIASWRQLTTLEPLSGRFAFGYLAALAARGDRAEALAFARSHTALVRRELETDVDPDIRRLEVSLRSMPAEPVKATSQQSSSNGAIESAGAVAKAVSTPPAAVPALTARPASGRRLTRRVAAVGLVAAGALVTWAAGLAFTERARAASAPAGAAHRLYQEGLRAYYLYDFGSAQRLIREALRDDSTFAMAAYYDALLTADAQDRAANDRALRLAALAPERERRLITTDLTGRLESPDALVQADSMAARWPNDARVLATSARVRFHAGDWSGAASALERSVGLDSAAATDICYVCEDLGALAEVYFWWDSLPAARRAAERYARLRPNMPQAWEVMAWSATRAGDTASARRAFRRIIETAPAPAPASAPYEARFKLMLEMYDTVQADVRPLLESPKRDDVLDARWWVLIALRNQGRLREAREFNETGRLAGVAPPLVTTSAEPVNEGMLALERGDSKEAAAAFAHHRGRVNPDAWLPGFAARNLAWTGTLLGMALAATGDTSAVLRMADTVEYWGQRSLYGRDRRSHHYLRGLVHAAAGRNDDAIRELTQAIHSRTLGFTRVNFELGRVLLRQNRAREAMDVLAPALRGEIDASNLYVTRTELHELLAQAFDRAGEPDSAAVHYRTVVRAWANADEMFHARRNSARAWLTRYERRGLSFRTK
jgi:DNA-binding SARP family transcriptional activator